MTELIRVEDLRVVACGERGDVEIVKGVTPWKKVKCWR